MSPQGYGYSKQKEPVQVIMQGGLNGNPANYAGGQPGFNHIVQPQASPSGVPVQGLVPPPLAGTVPPALSSVPSRTALRPLRAARRVRLCSGWRCRSLHFLSLPLTLS